MPIFPMNVRPIVPGLKATVEVRSARANGASVGYSCEEVTVHPLSRSEVERSDGVYLYGDRRFVFSRSGNTDLGLALKQRDSIIYNGEAYTVLTLSEGSIFDQVKAIARNLKIAYDLQDLVSIYRIVESAGTLDDAGRMTINPGIQPLALNTPCRIQPLDREIVDTFGGDRLEKIYNVYLESIPHDLKLSDQPRHSDGRIFEIKSVGNLETLDRLPMLTVVDNGARWDG